MKKNRFLPFFFAFLLLLAQAPAASAIEPFSADARAALLIEDGSGEILYEKNSRQEHYPASITKVTVALLVLEAIDNGRLTLSTPVTASESAFVGLAADGSTANIKPGETMTVEELLYCMMVVSANEACNILAEAVSGSVETFVAQMNERAAQLGCENTHYVNTSGLHDDQHYTSAWDIYLITREAMKNELFMTICNTKTYEVPATNLSDARTLHTTNYLISNWRAIGYLYDGAQGIKTGSTPEAGYCLVSSAVRGSRRLISVVLGAERVKEGDATITKSFSETSRLFDYGFNNFSSKDIVFSDEPVCEVPVALSSETNYVVAHPADDVTRMLPNDLAVESLERSVSLYQESVDAPVAAGDELGTLTVSYGDTVYCVVPLLALSDVSASWILTAQRDAKEFLSQTWVRLAAGAAVAVVAGVALVVRFSASSRRRYGSRRSEYSRSGYRGRRRR